MFVGFRLLTTAVLLYSVTCGVHRSGASDSGASGASVSGASDTGDTNGSLQDVVVTLAEVTDKDHVSTGVWTALDARVRVNTPRTPRGNESWRPFINVIELLLAISGVLVNVLTIFALWTNGKGFSECTATLLKHQSFLDAVVCGMGASVFIQRSEFWKLGNYTIDWVLCYVWHSQYIYWAWVLLSVWNLVFISVDRLLAVCYPLYYKVQTKRKLWITIAVMYLPCMMCPVPSIFDVSYDNGTCREHEQEGSDTLFSEVFAIFWAVVAYFTPVTLFLVFYTRIILSLRNKRIQVKRVIDNEIVGGSSRRLGSKRNGSTRTGVASTAGGVANQTSASLAITVSTLRITKCAITVTCIFICTVSYDSIFYLVGNTVTKIHYDLGSPSQLIGIMLMTINSLSNPLMYAVFLPAFRRSVRTLMTRKCNAISSIGGTTSMTDSRTNSTNSYVAGGCGTSSIDAGVTGRGVLRAMGGGGADGISCFQSKLRSLTR